MTVPPTLGGNLPKDTNYNGLPDIEKQLIDPLHAGDIRYAIVKYRTNKIVRKVADGDVYPVLEITHIEPIGTQAGEDAAAALLKEHFTNRTGLAQIPEKEEQPMLDMTAAETTESTPATDLGNDDV